MKNNLTSINTITNYIYRLELALPWVAMTGDSTAGPREFYTQKITCTTSHPGTDRYGHMYVHICMCVCVCTYTHTHTSSIINRSASGIRWTQVPSPSQLETTAALHFPSSDSTRQSACPLFPGLSSAALL